METEFLDELIYEYLFFKSYKQTAKAFAIESSIDIKRCSPTKKSRRILSHDYERLQKDIESKIFDYLISSDVILNRLAPSIHKIQNGLNELNTVLQKKKFDALSHEKILKTPEDQNANCNKAILKFSRTIGSQSVSSEPQKDFSTKIPAPKDRYCSPTVQSQGTSSGALETVNYYLETPQKEHWRESENSKNQRQYSPPKQPRGISGISSVEIIPQQQVVAVFEPEKWEQVIENRVSAGFSSVPDIMAEMINNCKAYSAGQEPSIEEMRSTIEKNEQVMKELESFLADYCRSENANDVGHTDDNPFIDNNHVIEDNDFNLHDFNGFDDNSLMLSNETNNGELSQPPVVNEIEESVQHSNFYRLEEPPANNNATISQQPANGHSLSLTADNNSLTGLTNKKNGCLNYVVKLLYPPELSKQSPHLSKRPILNQASNATAATSSGSNNVRKRVYEQERVESILRKLHPKQ